MNTDKGLGAGLIALGIAGIATTAQISVRTFNDDPGPKLFPMIAFAILIFCGLGMIFVRSGSQIEREFFVPQALRRGAAMFALMIAYSVGLWLAGFYVATPLALYGFYHLIAGPERRKLWRGVAYALIVTAFVHLIFATILNSLLPPGILW
jgi:hypothetical protein